MLKAHDITFLRLLTVGYISSETYHAVKKYGTIGNLPMDELSSFPEKSKDELKKLFFDEETVLNIALLEKADKDLEENEGIVTQVLDEVISCLNANDLIAKIGRKRFVIDYAFCSREMLRDSYAVSITNYSVISRFVNRFKLAYQSRLEGEDEFLDDSLNIEEDNKKIEPGIGFEGKDLIVIESDALSEKSKNKGYDKYVKYLYGLNKQQFMPYEDFILSCAFGRRTENCIRDLGIRNFYVNYLFAEPKKMLHIRKFGRKSYFELQNVLQDIISYVISSSQNTQFLVDIETEEKDAEDVKKMSLKEIAGNDKYQLIEAKYRELLKESTLTVRARNGIACYKGDFIEDFVHFDNDVKSLRMIGRKSEEEIKGLIEKLRIYIDEIIKCDLSEEEKEILLLKSKYGSFMDEYACKVYSERKHTPMFYITEKILLEQSKRDNKILFLNYLLPMVKCGDQLTIEEIAENNNLTRERVRQLCSKGIDYLYGLIHSDKSDLLDFSKIVSLPEDWSYIKEKLQNDDIIRSHSIEEFLLQENCNLTVSFGILLVLRVFDGEFCVVGNRPYDMGSRTKSLWNNSFIVKHEIVDTFDFDEMRSTIEIYQKEHETDENVCKTAEELVLDFFMSSWRSFDSSKVEAVANVVSEILMKEYGLIPDEEFRFLIQGQKTLTASDVLFRVLSEKYEPMSVDELYEILQMQYSFKYKSPASIRGIVNSDTRLCMVGVDNLVALSEWEHIKLGSVREIIVQFLEQFEKPKPVSEIVEYVLRYRDTTENSIRSTMYSGSQFRQFANGYFGLTDKFYPNEYIYAQSPEFKQRVQEMESFLIDKGHFPFSSSEDNSEINLRQWWHRNKNSDLLNTVQKGEIKRIQDSYWYLPTDKREVRWFSVFNMYREFVDNYGRRPSCYIEREKSLAEWFAKTQKEFVEGELSENEERVYLHLCKIL